MSSADRRWRWCGRGSIARISPSKSDTCRATQKKEAELLEALRGLEGTSIVYTATVKHVAAVAAMLEGEGLSVQPYHGKLAAGRRTEAQERFMAGELAAIVATNAFGLGIDKPDIRACCTTACL
ncbi:MAG TPA: helicase-related protein [Gemmatimonadales bacterium]|nr:helicase-related protein [Gemmatimonadales bacterium]